MRNAITLGGLLAAMLILASPALAADITMFPDCGAPGDPVVLRGEDFGDDPVVKFGGVEAEVVRSNGTRILCLVPDDATEGEAGVTVDGTSTATDFNVLADGAPVVLRMSAETAVPGQRLFLVGRRLGGGEVRFLDSTGETAATVDPRGRRHAITFAVPDDLDAGDYRLEVENGDGVDSGDCSPALEIVAAGDPELTAVSPEGALPGRHVTLTGTDLAPLGPCRVEWEDSSGDVLRAPGFSNGYDEIRTFVPFRAEAGETYEIVATLRGGEETSGVVEYEVGTYDDPSISEIDPDAGPAGSLTRIRGENLLVLGSRPEVTFTKGGVDTEARIFGAIPGIRDRDDEILVRVPADLADGEYDVTVTVGDDTTDAVTFTVGDLDLTVTGMRPDGQGKRGSFRPVAITGTGFGSMRDDTELTVVWDDGTDEYEGKVLFRSDRLLLVAPPGGRKDPLPEGTYDVEVILDPDGTPESASAGTYTVS